jgi:TRAP transporter TAXI family solute receptor
VKPSVGQWRRTIPIAAVAAVAGCYPYAAEPPSEGGIRLITGLKEGSSVNQAIGEALAREYAQASPPRDFELLESVNGAVDTLEALEQGTTDFGITLADVAYLAFSGQLEGHDRFRRLRGVAVLDLVPVHLLVHPDAGIRDVSGMRRHSVSIGPAGSEARLIADVVLSAFGVPRDAMRAEALAFPAALAQLASGELDAMFVTVTDPAVLVSEATANGARLLPIEGPAIKRLRQEYPFLQLTGIQGGIYAGHPEPTRTIGVEKVLLCRGDLPEQVVHEFTARLFNVLPRVSASLGPGRFTALEHAPATPVPLHAGAARYYRERELSR